jgi:hypothetical protein
MRDRRLISAGLLMLGCAAAVPIAAGTTQEDAGGSTPPPEVEATVGQRPAGSAKVLPCTGASEAANFRLFSLGRSFEGHPLKTVIRRCDNPDPWGSANYVSYIYGDCTPQPADGETYVDGGCAPPLEVQIWPSCERRYAGRRRAQPQPLRRGVPVARVEGSIELYSDDSTVVIFGTDAGRVDRAVSAIQPIARGSAPAAFPPRLQRTDALPPPEAEALTEQNRCTP